MSQDQTPMQDGPSETEPRQRFGAAPCSLIYCILEKTVPERGSLRDRYIVKLCNGRTVQAMAIEATPKAAVEVAQKRAADLVRGLQEMHDAITKGPIETI